MKLKSIDDIKETAGKRIFLRLCMNVPTANGKVAEDFRLQRVLPTLKTLIDRGAIVTVGTHVSGEEGAFEIIAKYLHEQVPAEKFKLLPNLRDNEGEKANSEEFARELAKDQDIYVNEDFAVSHRAHASVVTLPTLLPPFVGYQFLSEVENLSRFLNPAHPSVVVLGGAKIETKLPMIGAFVKNVDQIFLAGKFASELPDDPILKNEKVVLPEDVVSHDGKVVDIGPNALAHIENAVRSARSVIWNGPLGYFEAGFDESTKSLARTIASLSVDTVVGGGDSIASIRSLGLLDKFTFVSTGGGAMLDYLVDGSLPGIEAILSSKAKLPPVRRNKLKDNTNAI